MSAKAYPLNIRSVKHGLNHKTILVWLLLHRGAEQVFPMVTMPFQSSSSTSSVCLVLPTQFCQLLSLCTSANFIMFQPRQRQTWHTSPKLALKLGHKVWGIKWWTLLDSPEKSPADLTVWAAVSVPGGKTNWTDLVTVVKSTLSFPGTSFIMYDLPLFFHVTCWSYLLVESHLFWWRPIVWLG